MLYDYSFLGPNKRPKTDASKGFDNFDMQTFWSHESPMASISCMYSDPWEVVNNPYLLSSFWVGPWAVS